MAGAITAAGLHGVLYDKYLKGVTAAGLVPKAKASVADLSGDHTGKAIVGLGVAGALVGMLMSVERLSGSGMPFLPRSLAQTRWHPVLCGMMIGSLQLPLTLALSKNVGSASTMQTLSSLLFWKTDRFPKVQHALFVSCWRYYEHLLTPHVLLLFAAECHETRPEELVAGHIPVCRMCHIRSDYCRVP